MANRKTTWNAEKVLSISAICISFVTLIIFVFQTNLLVNQTKLLGEQNYLSILPYLALSTSNRQEDFHYELNVKNDGVGPAIIESVILTYEGEQYDLEDFDHSIYQFLVNKAPALDTIKDFSASTLNKGLAIPANTTYHTFSVSGDSTNYNLLLTHLNQLLEKGLEYEITYKSIQKERWRIHNTSTEPERLD